MGFSWPTPYRNPTTGQIVDGSVNIDVKQEMVIDRNDPRVLLTASGGGKTMKMDITQQIIAMATSRRSGNAFEAVGGDGFARLTAKKTISDLVLTVSGDPIAEPSVPVYAGISAGFPDDCIGVIYDGIGADGLAITPEVFSVISTSESADASTITCAMGDATEFANIHYKGALIKRVNLEDLQFLYANSGINDGESYKAQMERPARLADADFTVTDAGSQVINVACSYTHALGFTPYFDIYVRSKIFTNIRENWFPELTTSSPPTGVELRDLPLATLTGGVNITSYGGGADCVHGGALSAGYWWVGIVTKDGQGMYNINESLPRVKKVLLA